MWLHGMSTPAVLSISPSATVFPLQAFANWGPALSAIALASGIVKTILGPVDGMRTFSWNEQRVCAIRKNSYSLQLSQDTKNWVGTKRYRPL